MKKFIAVLSALIFAFVVYADAIKLPDGNVIMWQNKTSSILYESYRVEIDLYQPSSFNVWGTVTLGGQTKNFLIYAGETSTYVDFEGLTNGKCYQIFVKVNNEKTYQFPQK